MAKKHYHILQGLQGLYMPDSNYTVTSKRAAHSAARNDAESWNEGEMQRDPKDRDYMKQLGPGNYCSKYNRIWVDGPCFGDCGESHD